MAWIPSAAKGATYSTTALQFFNRVSATDTTWKTRVAVFIDTLVGAGVWAKADAIYVLKAPDSTTALTNLVSSSYTATTSGSPAFAADVGFNSASGKYIDTNFNPTTASS